MATPKQTDPQFKLRLPLALKGQIETAAADNSRTMNAEIIDRLQLTFDARWMARTTMLDEAIKAFSESSREMSHQADVLKWMHEQQSVTMHLLELIANSDGHLKPEFMETLRSMLARRGDDTGFPEGPSAERD